MQEVRVGAKYVFEVEDGAPGLYMHQIESYEPEEASHDERYMVLAWRVEVTDKPGELETISGPVRAWHSAEAIHRYYRDRWS